MSKFFEMDNLYIIWFYAFRFVSWKFRVDAFSLLYSNLCIVKLCLYVIGANFAALHWQLISNCSSCICD